MIREDARAFARSVLSRERLVDGLRRVVPALNARDVPVMPLKGMLLACCLADALDRPMADADLLVPRSSFARALSTLVALGGRALPVTGVTKCAVVFGVAPDEWNVDLHADLWPAGFVALDLNDAWATSTTAPSPFGAPVRLPPRRFAFAHAAAHFARSGHSAALHPARAREISALLDWTLETEGAAELARYLNDASATAAVRYALASASAVEPRPTIVTLEEHLPLDRARVVALRYFARNGTPHPRLIRPLLT